jgi:hypothetical protein
MDDFDNITCEEFYAEDEQRRAWMDELELDWDEPYHPDGVEDTNYEVSGCNEDAYLDSAYEDRYDLGDF